MQSSKSRCCAGYGIKWGVKGYTPAIIPARSWVCIKRAAVNTTQREKEEKRVRRACAGAGARIKPLESCKAGEDGISLLLLLLLRGRERRETGTP